MSSVRERMAVQAGQNRGLNTDHSHDVFGSLVVTGKVENAKAVSYTLRCAVCGSTGQRVTQQQLEDPKFVVKCANLGCGQTSAPRSYDASVQIQQRDGTAGSARQRADAAARAAEIAATEQEEGQ
jgi:hypothetical protein